MSGANAIRHPHQPGFATSLFVIMALFVGALAVAGWVSVGIVTSDRWPIRWLEINGGFQRVSAEQVRASLAAQVGASFFTVDLEDLQLAASRISWVSNVKVEKRWPDTIRVSVREYVPVAHWNRGQLLADDGRQFSVPEADEIQGLPWLEGPESRSTEVVETWIALDELLLPLGLEIERMKLNGRGAWSLMLNNGTRVQLGRDSTIERLQRLLASWELLLEQNSVAPLDVDLRYTNGFAVSWPEMMGGGGQQAL